MAVSIIAPILYIAFLFGPLYIFSKYYMRQKNYRPTKATWFPNHHTRDLYISLLSHDPQPPQHILSAALMRRAMTDVQRVMSIRASKEALSQLLQKGLIGDEFWNGFLEAEKELEAELTEVVGEANTFKQGWGQAIFAQANDMVQHSKLKGVVEAVESNRELEKAKYTPPTKEDAPISIPAQPLIVQSAVPAMTNPSTANLQAAIAQLEAQKNNTAKNLDVPQSAAIEKQGSVSGPSSAANSDDEDASPNTSNVTSPSGKSSNKKSKKGKKKK